VKKKRIRRRRGEGRTWRVRSPGSWKVKERERETLWRIWSLRGKSLGLKGEAKLAVVGVQASPN
jgi:hypothetical protein